MIQCEPLSIWIIKNLIKTIELIFRELQRQHRAFQCPNKWTMKSINCLSFIMSILNALQMDDRASSLILYYELCRKHEDYTQSNALSKISFLSKASSH